MNILALDCSGDDLLIGLAADGRVNQSWRITARRRHSELLPGQIGSCLAECRLTFADLDGYTIVSGPGSYTGLRVGAATVMGLIAAGDLPVAALSTFEFLRRLYQSADRPLGCVLPCRGDLYYWTVFEPGEKEHSPVEVLTLAEIIATLDCPYRLVGPRVSAIAELTTSAEFSHEILTTTMPEAAGKLALWGEQEILAGRIVDPNNWRLDYGPMPGFQKWSKPQR